MGFKLVRVDVTESCKVPLPVGSHFVGRGMFLDCNDHRVSRKHAELIVTADFVELKSLHQNPCFVKRKSSTETIIFSQPDSQVLNNGDQFGLIPDSYWFEVINCLDDSPTDTAEGLSLNETTSNETNGQIKSKTEDNEHRTIRNECDTQQHNVSVIDQRSESPSLLPSGNPSSPTFTDDGMEILLADLDTTSAEQLVESTNQPDKSTNQPVESPNQSVVSTNQPVESSNQSVVSTNQPAESPNQSVVSRNQQVEPINQDDESTDNSIESTIQGSNKRSHSQETIPYDVKKVKTEPETPTKDHEVGSNDAVLDQPVKTEPGSPQDVKPGPSNVQGGSSSDGNNNGPAMPKSPVKPPNKPLRERCMYGANCYRKNPQHKASFSHPGDTDWGSGPRAECPWGAACCRRDPRHWRDHSHPAGAAPPPAPPPGYYRAGMQLVRRHGNNFYINANSVHFYDDHFQVEDSDGDSVDFDYEF